MEQEITTKIDELGVLTVTLNRPEKLNALTNGMMNGLRDVVRTAAVDPEVRVVILTGAGRGFCAGGDVFGNKNAPPADPIAAKWGNDPVWNTAGQRADRLMSYADASVLLHTMGKPTIAMVRGPCAGAGLSLATCTDLRVISDTTMFTFAFSKIARTGDYGCSYFVTKLVGAAKTKELFYFSEKFGAEEALKMGLVNRVVPDAKLEEETMALARRLAKAPGTALRYIKRNINAAENQTLHQVLDIESYNMVLSAFTEDAAEVASAMAEKREPKFKGY